MKTDLSPREEAVLIQVDLACIGIGLPTYNELAGLVQLILEDVMKLPNSRTVLSAETKAAIVKAFPPGERDGQI